MSNKKDISNNRIKYFYILLLSIILCPLLILNSNKVLEKRTEGRILKQFGANIKERFFGRHLLSFDEGVEKICKRGSEELNNYYITRVDETIGLDEEDEDEKDNEKTPEYIDALIDIVKGTTGKSDKEMSDNLMTYGQHLIGVFICLAIAILAIPGWLICCSCCCCNCCCCCCCKKPTCKFPFFIVTLALYVLVAGICVYGLIKSNSIFRGLSDTECSILQFFNETIEGEAKAQTPKWAGVEGIKSILNDLDHKIGTIGGQTLLDLEGGQNEIATQKGEFADLLHDQSALVTGNNKYTITSTEYQIDITTTSWYGTFPDHEGNFEGTGVVNRWYKEYSLIADGLDRNLGDAYNNFNTIIGNEVKSNLNNIKNSVEEMGTSIKEVKDGMADSIVEYSDYIDEYGKLGFKIFFSALVVIDAAIAALMFLLCFCSGEKCKNCCLFRCGFKLLIHLFWNILALLMIITLFIGFIFTLIGSIGKDLTYVVNYFIGEENMNQAEPALFGAEGKKLSTCFNGNGDILKVLDDEGSVDLDQIKSFDNINDLIEEIKSAETQFSNLKSNCQTYNMMMGELDKRVNYKEDFGFCVVGGTCNNIQSFLDALNTELSSPTPPTYLDQWYISCDNQGSNCKSLKRDTIGENQYGGSVNVKKVYGIQQLVRQASSSTETNSFKQVTDYIRVKFNDILTAEIGILTTFRNNLKKLTGVFDAYIGENGGFADFVNCKFIDSNVKVILKNLRKGVGNSFYSIGICLVLAGCSLAVAISFTILLVIIINTSVDSNKNKP